MNPKKRRTKARRKSSSHRSVARHRNTASVAHKRRRRSNVAHRRTRRRNPTMVMRNRHHRRRSSNPMSSWFPDVKGLSMDVLYLAGGGITTRSIPQLVLPSQNTGWMGYVLNLLTAGITGGIIGKWRGAAASRPWLLGGLAFTIARVIDDYAGVQILSFAQYSPPFTLSGDATYGMRGIYATYNFPLPSNSLPAGAPPLALPAPAPAGSPAAAMSGLYGSFN